MKTVILLLMILLCNSCLMPEDIYEEPRVAKNVKLIISDRDNQIKEVHSHMGDSSIALKKSGELFICTLDSIDYDENIILIELTYHSGVIDTVEQRFYTEDNGMFLGIQEDQFYIFSDHRGAHERDLLKLRVNESGDTVQLFENGFAYSSVESDSGVWYFDGHERSYGRAIALFGDSVEYRFGEVELYRRHEKYQEWRYFSVIRYEGASHETMVPVGADLYSM